MEHVEQRLQQYEEREERSARRREEALRTEFDKTLKDINERIANAYEGDGKAAMGGTEEAPSNSGGRQPLMKIPSYDGTQPLERYLDLFEDICSKNEFEESEWLLRLRIALAGSKAERICIGCNNYEEAKRELLASLGKTPDKAWKTLLTGKQRSDESFHQYVVRVCREVEVWATLAMTEDGEVDTKYSADIGKMSPVLQAMAKQVILEQCGPEMKTYLVERQCYGMSLRQVQEHGASYQVAHGRQGDTARKPVERSVPRPTASAQCMAISVADAEKQLKSLPLEGRKGFLQRERLCWNCLKYGHMARECRSGSRCTKCQRKHHLLIHEVLDRAGYSREKPTEIVTEKNVGSCCLHSPSVRLMTGVARVEGRTRNAKVRVFLDSGAEASFVTAALVSAIDAEHVGVENVEVKPFGAEPTQQRMDKYAITIQGSSASIRVRAFVKPTLEMDLKCASPQTIAQWHSWGVELSDKPQQGTSDEIHMLIGADYINAVLHSKKEVNGETVWNTEIGNVLSGPASALSRNSQPVTVSCVTAHIEQLWQLDEPPEQHQHLPSFPLCRQGSGYQVGLLWRNERRPTDNFAQARVIATRLLEKLKRNGKRALYDDVLIREYRELGAIELEPCESDAGYYVPHHGVFREHAATTKLRVVFNASATAPDGKSLNDMVDPGPSLLPSLAGMLLRFREYKSALQADIRKAFFMVAVNPEDRPYLRFLWPGRSDSDELLTWRLTKLPFGVNCSPYMLTAVIQHHLKELRALSAPKERDRIDLLLTSFYVDDLVSSVSNASEAKEMQEFSVRVLTDAGMELRKWRGNEIPCDPEAGDKVLGLKWKTSDDLLSIAALGESDRPSVWTRRSLLKCVASVFDPLGLAAPAVVPGKILLQQAWKVGGDWDDMLPDGIAAACAQWWGELAEVVSIDIPRWICCNLDTPIALHAFADASEKAFGCCLYAVVNGQSHLVFAKAKVSPVSPPTLARLELQAVCLAARYAEFVVKELRVTVTQVYGWTDSLTTVHWISNPSYKWKTFVANRVSQVQEISKKVGIVWNHCPGLHNPADLPSRGSSAQQIRSPFWRGGPTWITEPNDWPTASSTAATNESSVEVRVSATTCSRESDKEWWLRFSKWSRAQGMVTRMLQWKHTEPRAELYFAADNVLYRIVQAACFAEDLELIKQGQPVKPGSKVYQLAPFLDEHGVLRAGGRLQHSELAYGAKHPVLLGKHHLTDLLLEKMHVERMHQGVEGVLSFIRQKFWIIGGRRALRNITQRCVTCRRYKAKAASEVCPPLPEDRVVHERPFATTGIDYAGPLYVRRG